MNAPANTTGVIANASTVRKPAAARPEATMKAYITKMEGEIKKEQALKDLAVLQKDAKSTAAEIARLDQKLAAAKSDTKLADNLRQAQKAAADTAAELERVNTKLETAKQTELAKIKATPGFRGKIHNCDTNARNIPRQP